MKNLRTYGPMLGAALAVLAAPATGSAADAEKDTAGKGRAILETYCARCHAIGLTGASTHPQAPPFRDVVKRYPVEDLAESLAEGIVSGHPDMPEFTFEPNDINAILTYLDSLKASETGK